MRFVHEEAIEKEGQRHESAYSELFEMLLRIANYAYMVKASFFKEEAEWRILVLLTKENSALVLPSAQL